MNTADDEKGGSAIEKISQNIRVNFRYDVHFTENAFSSNNLIFRDVVSGGGVGPSSPNKVLAVVDSEVARWRPGLIDDIGLYCRDHRRHLSLTGPPLIVVGGEAVKNDPRYVAEIQREIHEAGLCRHSFVAAIGGGAVIDAVGYAAVTAHRGVRLIRVPTTVLAQDDAALGVKNGINAFGKKNFIGTFAPPYAVVNDFTFLTTLSHRDWISGVAEAVKVALIKDAPFFEYIRSHARALLERDMSAMQRVIHRCAGLHLNHIATSGDPFEMGSSRPLDFGHWSAHKLEQLSAYSLRHGEAVAIGMALDATYSHLSGLLSKGEWQRILDTLHRIGFALYTPELDGGGEVLAGLEEFREHLGGRLTIMLLSGIGQGVEVNRMDAGTILTAIEMLRERGGGRLAVPREA